ncbi:nucleoside hydrolase [Bombilactobacillus bombi]|uniref:nucleoside hydrolase n=1 Tax=Bombilactobacillus bombi TaxID=1303590 RepID=UPI0015E611D8|nr:nucleoside hydrolase [Bombilactobacillus bombi]
MQNIIFDCDPGSDDAIAILETFAHPEAFSVLAMTTVGGNGVLKNVTKNLQHLLWFLKQTTPLAPGQATPIIKNLKNATEIHGESGLAGPTFPEAADSYPLASHNGITLLHETIQKSTTPITVVATGPLTNIALLLKVFPEDRDKIQKLVIMGGALKGGNVTELAEFNFYVDPDAAHIVMQSGLPIVLCGLDVTLKTGLTFEQITSLEGQGPASQLAYEILMPYFTAEQGEGLKMAAIHDLATITYLLDSNIYQGQHYALEVDNSWGSKRGHVQISQNGSKNVLVLEKVNTAKTGQLLLDSLKILDEKLS